MTNSQKQKLNELFSKLPEDEKGSWIVRSEE